MKLAKKMLASVIALAMVVALALTAFAAAPVVSLTASDAVVGENVTITMSATGLAGLESADLEFAFDAEALEFVSVEKAAGAAYDMGAGGNVEAGVVTWSLLYLESATADGDLVTLTFKVLKAGDTTVSVKYVSWDGTEMPAEASVTVKATEKVVPPVDDEPASVVDPTTKDPEPTTKGKIDKTGEAGVAAIAGVMAIAAVAFVATRKKDEE